MKGIKVMKFSSKSKRILAFIVVALFAVAALLPLTSMMTNADSVSDLQKKIQNSQNKKKEIKKDINEKTQQKKSIQEEIKAYDAQISVLNSEISDMNAKIAQDDAVISKVQTELNEATERAEKQYETYKERIRVMYENGNESYLDVLLKAESFSDFLNRYEIVKQITEYDNNMVSKMEQTKKTIADNKAQLEQVRAQKVTRVNSLNASKSSLAAKSNEKNSLVASLNSSIAELEKQVKQQDAEEAATRAQIAKLQQQRPKVAYTGGSMVWPVPSTTLVTSNYGYRFHPVLKYNRLHAGMDIGARTGASVVAANSGTVIKAEYNSSYGNHVVIDHGGGICTLYAHASRLLVSRGQTVKAGQEIMKAGSTGIVSGPHLHFEVLINGKTTNPAAYLY